jgi:hypothetical protein
LDGDSQQLAIAIAAKGGDTIIIPRQFCWLFVDTADLIAHRRPVVVGIKMSTPRQYLSNARKYSNRRLYFRTKSIESNEKDDVRDRKQLEPKLEPTGPNQHPLLELCELFTFLSEEVLSVSFH